MTHAHLPCIQRLLAAGAFIQTEAALIHKGKAQSNAGGKNASVTHEHLLFTEISVSGKSMHAGHSLELLTGFLQSDASITFEQRFQDQDNSSNQTVNGSKIGPTV